MPVRRPGGLVVTGFLRLLEVLRMIVLFGGEKGGTGKSQLCLSLAAARKLAGHDVLLVDCDPQASTSLWCALRDDARPEVRIPCVQKTGAKIHADIKDLASRYEDVLIDAGGRDSVELRAALTVAHKVYTPIRPRQFDAWTLEKMDQLVDQAMAFNPSLRAYIVMNMASPNPRTSEADDAVEFAADMQHLRPVKTIIRERMAFARSASEGLTVMEMSPKDHKAVAEIMALYAEVFDNGA